MWEKNESKATQFSEKQRVNNLPNDILVSTSKLEQIASVILNKSQKHQLLQTSSFFNHANEIRGGMCVVRDSIWAWWSLQSHYFLLNQISCTENERFPAGKDKH